MLHMNRDVCKKLHLISAIDYNTVKNQLCDFSFVVIFRNDSEMPVHLISVCLFTCLLAISGKTSIN